MRPTPTKATRVFGAEVLAAAFFAAAFLAGFLVIFAFGEVFGRVTGVTEFPIQPSEL
jgi:hypothetical protein